MHLFKKILVFGLLITVVGNSFFAQNIPPFACSVQATVITSLPTSFVGLTTCGAGNDLTALNTNLCVYNANNFGGEDMLFSYTPADTGLVVFHFYLLNDYAALARYILYENCPLAGGDSKCVGEYVYKNNKDFEIITKVKAGKTYYLLVDATLNIGCSPFNLYVTDCTQPKSLSAQVLTNDSVRVKWYLPGGHIPDGGFEWKIGTDKSHPDSVGLKTGISQKQEVIVIGLPNGQTYKAFVRSLCADTLTTWAASPVFRTWSKCPENLGPLSVINDFPAQLLNQTSCGLGDELNYLNTSYCANGGGVFNGMDAVYQFNAPVTGPMAMVFTSAAYTNAMLYEGCPFNFQAGVCLGTVRAYNGGPEIVANISAGKTYYIVVDHGDYNGCAPNFNLQLTDCVSPTLLKITDAKTAQPKIQWTVPNNAYPSGGFEWRVTADTSGPEGPIVQSGIANGNSVSLLPLPSARYFRCYVRSLCTDGPARWIVSDRVVSNATCPDDLGETTTTTSFPAYFSGKTTCGKGNKINKDFSPLCNVANAYEYDGQDAVYPFVSPANGMLGMYLNSQAKDFSMSIFSNCPFESDKPCIRFNRKQSPGLLELLLMAEAGRTYYLVVDRPGKDSCMQYDLHLTACYLPGSVVVSKIYRDSALLSWAAPNDPMLPQGYEWKILLADTSQNAQPLLSGTAQTAQVQLAGLPAASTLKAYVRMQCGPTDFSPWYPSNIFKTPYRCPDNLGAVTVVPSLPFQVINATTCGQGDDIRCQSLKNCKGDSYCNYMYGEDVIYQYTPPEDACAIISFKTLPPPGSFYFAVYKDCPFEQLGCLRSGFTKDSFPVTLQGGHTYYFYLDQADWHPCLNFNLSINQLPPCGSVFSYLDSTLLTASSAEMHWSWPTDSPCYSTNGYEWRLVAPGTGPDGTILKSGMTTPNIRLVNLTGLTPSTDYDFYVRSWCRDTVYGNWSDVFNLTTKQACPGSLDSVQIIGSLPFHTFATTCGQGYLPFATLCGGSVPVPGEDAIWSIKVPKLTVAKIYFRSEIGGATVHLASWCPLLGAKQGQTNMWCKMFEPTLVGADSISVQLLPTRNYYIVIDNQLANTCGGYELRIDTFSSCGTVQNIAISNVQFDKAQLTWTGPLPLTSGVQEYEIRVIQAGGSIEQPVSKLVVPYNILKATPGGLRPGTSYECYMRAKCNVGISDWVGPITFTTLVCPMEVQSNGYTSLTGVPQVLWGESTCGKGDEFNNSAPGSACQTGAGEDALYRIQVPPGQNRYFFFHFRTQQPGATFSLYEDCTLGTACITSVQAADKGVYGFAAGLVATRTYYLLADHFTAGTCFDFDLEMEAYDSLYAISEYPGPAYAVPLGVACKPQVNTGVIYNPGFEPLSNCMSDTATLGWVYFIAPPSGSITIRTSPVDSFSVFDTQLALYESSTLWSGNPVLLACDDDSGTACIGCSMISHGGLIPGEQYYIAIAAGRKQTGKFCLLVEEDLNPMKHQQVAVYEQPGVSGKNWVNISDGAGGVLAAIQPNENALGTVTIQTLSLSDVPKIATGAYVVPRTFQISCDGPACGGQFAKPVSLRLVFADEDLEAFNDSTGLNLSLANMRVFHYDGLEEDCDPTNNATLPTLVPVSQVKKFGLGSRSFSIELKTSSFSEFFIGSAGLISASQEAVAPKDWSVRIRPVPVHDELLVTFDLEEQSSVALALLLPTGRVCWSETLLGSLGANTVSVSMKDLPDGLYFLSLQQAGKAAMLKVVKSGG